MKHVKNLGLIHEDIKDLLKEQNKELLSVAPVIFEDNSGIVLENKTLYYGKLYSKDGVKAISKTKTHAYVQGDFDVECFFDSLVSFGNDYKFIGYKLLTNS